MKLESRLGGRSYRIEVKEGREEQLYMLTFVDLEKGETTSLEAQLFSRRSGRLTFSVDGRIYDCLLLRQGDEWVIEQGSMVRMLEIVTAREKMREAALGRDSDGVAVVKSLMPGRVIEVLKRVGDSVSEGEGLAVVEAMKMQNELKSPRSGEVVSCDVEEGQAVAAGAPLFEIS